MTVKIWAGLSVQHFRHFLLSLAVNFRASD